MQLSSRIRHDSTRYVCPHMGNTVEVNSTVVYPRGLLMGSPPRIIKRDCDHYADCRLLDKNACPMAVNRF